MNPPTLPDIEWRKAKSEFGNDYEIGVLAGSEPEPTEPPKRAPSSQIEVNWAVGQRMWIDASPEVQQEAAISRYILTNHDGTIYQYVLWITNTASNSYSFRDESGDSYGLTAIINRDHYILYNSPAPTIVQVSGW